MADDAINDPGVDEQRLRFERWLQNIPTTQDDEISCSECFELVSHFVEDELLGVDVEIQMPQVKQHLDQCPACRAEHETLRDLARLERVGKLPSIEELRDRIP